MSDTMNYAVGARRDTSKQGLDFFPTPPWATRALCEWLAERQPLHMMEVWESACGVGHMARPLSEYFARVTSSDIHDYGHGQVLDFLADHNWTSDWVITNPPFNLADEFAAKATICAARGAALLVRTSFLEGQSRYAELFSKNPPSDILQFVERVPMHKGRLLRHGSTATSYCWLVWRKGESRHCQFHWLAPCRKRLERDADYEIANDAH